MSNSNGNGSNASTRKRDRSTYESGNTDDNEEALLLPAPKRAKISTNDERTSFMEVAEEEPERYPSPLICNEVTELKSLDLEDLHTVTKMDIAESEVQLCDRLVAEMKEWFDSVGWWLDPNRNYNLGDLKQQMIYVQERSRIHCPQSLSWFVKSNVNDPRCKIIHREGNPIYVHNGITDRLVAYKQAMKGFWALHHKKNGHQNLYVFH